VFVVIFLFRYDSVRKLLDTPSCIVAGVFMENIDCITKRIYFHSEIVQLFLVKPLFPSLSVQ